MVLAYRFSEAEGLCAAGAADRIATHLRQCGMKAHPKDAGVTASGRRLVEHMMHDKKMEGGKLPFLLARGIGETFLARDVALDSVAARSEERRVGQGGVSTCRSRWSP